jgi:raffinose/stachyose/melibiose transport system substrate-binding protein
MRASPRLLAAASCAAALLFLSAAGHPAIAQASGSAKGASSPAGKNPITLTIIHEHSAEAAQRIVSSAGFVAMLDKYKAEHPWVKLEETIIANAQFNDKYLAAAAANELPDVCYVKPNWLDNLAGNKLVADITDYVDPSLYVDNLSCMTYKGRIYGLPTKYSIYNFVLYNEAMWKAAGYSSFPATLDELIQAEKRFAAKGIPTMSLGNKAKWFATPYFVAPLAYEYCGADWVKSIVAHDGKSKWTDASFVKVLAKVKEISGIVNKDCNMQDDIWALGWYMQGKAACHVIGSWGIDTAKGMAKDYPEVWKNTRVALLPTVSGKSGYLATAVGGAGIGVNSKLSGDKFKAALDLCKQIASRDYADFIAARGSTTAVKIDLDFSKMERPYQDFAAILKAHPSGMNLHDYIDPSVVTVLESNVQNLMAGNVTPQQAAASIQMAEDMLEMKK